MCNLHSRWLCGGESFTRSSHVFQLADHHLRQNNKRLLVAVLCRAWCDQADWRRAGLLSFKESETSSHLKITVTRANAPNPHPAPSQRLGSLLHNARSWANWLRRLRRSSEKARWSTKSTKSDKTQPTQSLATNDRICFAQLSWWRQLENFVSCLSLPARFADNDHLWFYTKRPQGEDLRGVDETLLCPGYNF